MCEAPDQTCQFMSPKEDETVFGNSGYLDGGTAYRGHKGIAVDFKEGHVQKVDTREYPNGQVSRSGDYIWARVPLSLACKGRVMVKAVFKQLSHPDSVGKTSSCASTKISPDSDTPVVRCELELPSGSGSEEARAVKAKEGKCYLCTACSKGGGCPQTVGKWYSETAVVTRATAGCDDVKSGKAKGYADIVSQKNSYVQMTFYTEYLMPQLKACSQPSCGFDAAYEDAKVKNALKCTPQGCP